MRKETGKFIILALVVIVVGSILQIHLARQIAYEQMANKVGYLLEQNPELEGQVMDALKKADQMDASIHSKGYEVLERYGYSTHNVLPEAWRLGIGIILVGLSIVALSLLFRKKYIQENKRRITGLTTYLQESKKGKSKSLITTKEDVFSKLEDELYKTVGELYQTREVALKEKDILKNHIADIAHQFKTPLTAMEMMCELIGEADLQEEEVYLQQIQNQLERLDRLVHSLLTLSKLEANVVEMENKVVSVYILILRVLELLELPIRSKNLQIELEPVEDETITFQGDIKWSIEALYNLVKNCMEHTPEGKKIKISYEKTPLFTCITIEDEGEGFIPEDIPYVFKRFYKGKNATKDSVGIGLALAHTIIEKQNGFVEAENREEGGARFRVKFYPSVLK